MLEFIVAAHQPMFKSDHSLDNVHKRVCKACDRCRLKKSKRDESSPYSRCRASNTVCIFGERRKAHDKVYPKGYVEMLEQQQAWLVRGLQELYRRTAHGQGWVGYRLRTQANGHPLTHDLLAHLSVLDESEGERFEEFCEPSEEELRPSESDHMQHQESPDGCSDSSGFSGGGSSLSSDDFFSSQRQFDFTQPAWEPTTQYTPQILGSLGAMLSNKYMSMHGVVNPLALQRGSEHHQQWGNGHSFNPSNQMDLNLVPPADCANLRSRLPAGVPTPNDIIKLLRIC